MIPQAQVEAGGPVADAREEGADERWQAAVSRARALQTAQELQHG